MIRSVVAGALLCLAVLFVPLYVQAVLFVGALLWIKHRWILIVPAVLADVLYRPFTGLSLAGSKTTIVVLVVLALSTVLIKKTRISSIIYGVEKD